MLSRWVPGLLVTGSWFVIGLAAFQVSWTAEDLAQITVAALFMTGAVLTQNLQLMTGVPWRLATLFWAALASTALTAVLAIWCGVAGHWSWWLLLCVVTGVLSAVAAWAWQARYWRTRAGESRSAYPNGGHDV